ncbi:MAG: putative metal-dependent hydrolase [Eudoraea sp.]|nr:putative metal-dependent hydrolase [Eudoraea sp.]
MDAEELKKLRYPIGKFSKPELISPEQISEWIDELESFPEKLTLLVSPLSEQQLDTPYRPDGWTIRQVIHHVSDSHHNSYIRFKWTLTETDPVIKPYDEKGWADLHDTRNGPIHMSLEHLRIVHAKLVYLLRGLDTVDLDRTFIHPDDNSKISLKANIGHYVWHGNHHYAHIEEACKRHQWI